MKLLQKISVHNCETIMRRDLKTRTVILQVIHRDFPSLQEGSSNILNECISL